MDRRRQGRVRRSAPAGARDPGAAALSRRLRHRRRGAGRGRLLGHFLAARPRPGDRPATGARAPPPRGRVLRLGAVRLAARRSPLGVGAVRGAVLPHRGRGAGAARARVDVPARRPLGHRRVTGATRAAVPLVGDDGSADVRLGLRGGGRRVGAAGRRGVGAGGGADGANGSLYHHFDRQPAAGAAPAPGSRRLRGAHVLRGWVHRLEDRELLRTPSR